jgi:hypothetical protein
MASHPGLGLDVGLGCEAHMGARQAECSVQDPEIVLDKEGDPRRSDHPQA